MNIRDIQNNIVNYLTNCGENPNNWDIENIVDEIDQYIDAYDDVNDMDDIPEDVFADIMQRNAR